LVDNELDVYFFENAFRDDIVQVRLHELEQKVHVFIVFCVHGVMQLNYIRVGQLLQYLYFPISALGVSSMLECVENLFEGIYALGCFFLNFPYMTISARSHLLEHVEAPHYVILDVGSLIL